MATTPTSETNQKELFITMALAAWNIQNQRVTKLLNTFTNEQWQTETAPNRNRGIYLLGHFIAVSDGLLPLFGLGERLYPVYEKVFLRSPDRAVAVLPSVEELKDAWEKVNKTLDVHFSKFTADDWFSRHNSVSEEDFAKEPHRNKLNVLLNRTSHTAYHLGQLAYLGPRTTHD
jgi:hypothetical protein